MFRLRAGPFEFGHTCGRHALLRLSLRNGAARSNTVNGTGKCARSATTICAAVASRIERHLRSCHNLGYVRAFGNSGGGMEDEYGAMTSAGESYVARRFQLESGVCLEQAEVRYNTYGQLSVGRDNVLVICHALTGNSDLASWWGGMLGPGKPFDTDRFFVVCANTLGSCYGSTGPMSIDPTTNQPYLNSFPDVTVRDTVRLHMQMIKDAVGATSVAAVVGGSFGGMQVLEWALCGGDFVRSIVPIACGGHHTAWQIGFSETQRQAIYIDRRWCGGHFDPADPPLEGLAVARQIAMISYRTAKVYHEKFSRDRSKSGLFEVRRYLEHQGIKFQSRMDPLSYIKLTEQMDTHDVGRDREGIDEALMSIRQPTLVIGIDSDVLYPLHEQEELVAKIPNSSLQVIASSQGHDGFLLEQGPIGSSIDAFLRALPS
eukprot:TRINITY_DN18719_c0_g1_i1.p1 TRINITY_DN18719_c0_g1~~TRINITY_DN18719_c0_g1_i1.p1  ORF type:complete len:431 (+),score=52.51 TRINITY_DN18719_c0_g1_i1:56-1348(+)